MAVTPEEIEQAERQAERNRVALERGGTVVPIRIGTGSSSLQKPPKISFEREAGGRMEHVDAVPVTVTFPRGLDVSLGTFAKTVRFEYSRVDCNIQRRNLFFEPFVLCQQTGLFLPGSDKGSQRLSRFSAWQPFDLWLVFSGKPRDRKLLKALGVSFLNKR